MLKSAAVRETIIAFQTSRRAGTARGMKNVPYPNPPAMLIVDAHLDLAYNALRGRDVLRPAAEQAADDEGIPTVGLPDLRAAGSASSARPSSVRRR